MWCKVIIFTVLSVLFFKLKQLRISGPSKFKYYFNFFIFYFYTFLSTTVMLPLCMLKPKNVKNAKIGAGVLKYANKLLDLEWQLRDGKILSEDRGAIIVSNHQSSLDALGMCNVWHVADKVISVVKKELFYLGPFGLYTYLSGFIFLDRSDAKESYKLLKIATEAMIKNKNKIWCYPEGTRNMDHSKLLPFKKGAFNIAVEAQVPIIPVVFSPYYFINKEKYIFDKGRIIIQCLEPVQTTGLTLDDVPDLIKQIHDEMTRTYKELFKEVISTLPPDYVLSLDKKNHCAI